MNNKKGICNSLIVVCLLLASLAIVAVSGCTTTEPPPGPKEIVVGATLPMSGPIGFVGIMFSRGYQIFFDRINEEGGIDIGGQQYIFKFIAEDDKFTAEGASIAANKLVYEDGATFLFSGVSEWEADGAYSVTRPAGVFLCCSSNLPGLPSDVGPDKPLLFRPQCSVDEATSCNFDYLQENYPDVRTIVTLATNIILDTPNASYIPDTAEERGLEVLATEIWDVTTTDFLALYTKVLAHNPDAIFLYNSAQGADHWRAANQLGFTGPMWDDCPLGAETYLYTEPNITNFWCNGPAINNLTPLMQEVRDMWEAKYTDPFMTDAAQVYDQAWILVQGIQKAQSIDPNDVMAALESMTQPGDVQTTFGPAYIGGMDRFGVNRVLYRQIPITLIMDGEIELIGYFDSSYK